MLDGEDQDYEYINLDGLHPPAPPPVVISPSSLQDTPLEFSSSWKHGLLIGGDSNDCDQSTPAIQWGDFDQLIPAGSVSGHENEKQGGPKIEKTCETLCNVYEKDNNSANCIADSDRVSSNNHSSPGESSIYATDGECSIKQVGTKTNPKPSGTSSLNLPYSDSSSDDDLEPG